MNNFVEQFMLPVVSCSNENESVANTSETIELNQSPPF